MAANVYTCNSQIRQISRLLVNVLVPKRTLTLRKRNTALKQPKSPDNNVYLLCYRPPPSHTFKEALDVLRAYAITNQDETVELNLRINMGTKRTTIQPFHGIVSLPKPYGSQKTILVFAEGELAEVATQAGADIVGGHELIEQVKEQSVKFNQCISTMDMLEKVKPLQKVLREKMPTIRRGTVTNDLELAIRTYKQAHPYRCDRDGVLNVGIAKLSFKDKEIKDNATALIEAINTYRKSTKEKFITKVMLSSTYGPGLQLHLDELIQL